MRVWAFIIIALGIGGCQILSRPSSRQPVLQQGILNLHDWSFTDQGNVSLQGDWKFTPQAFLDPRSLDLNAMQGKAHVPGSPNPQPLYIEGRSIGYGTFASRLILPADAGSLCLRLWMVQSAYELFVRNNRTGETLRLMSAGRTGKTRDASLGEVSEKLIPIPEALTVDGDITLVVQASAFYSSLGLPGVPRLGPSAAIYQEEIFKQIERALIMGGFGLIALYSLALYLGRRHSLLDFWSSLFACTLLLRYAATEMFVYWLFKGVAWIEPLTITLNYWSTQFSIVILCIIFASLHPLRMMLRIRNAAIAINALGLLLISVFGFDWVVEHALALGFALVMANGLALFLAMVYLRWKRAKDMDLAIVGFVVLNLAALNDYLVFFQGLPNIFLLPYAFLLFAFTQSLITGRRFARTFQRNEELLVEISEKERARTLFFHNTSHELRTPLNGLIGFLQLLGADRYGPQTSESRQQLMKCVRLAESLKNQVNTILDLAKSKKGRLALENSMISLDDLFTEASNLAEGLLLKRADSRFNAERNWTRDTSHFVGDREKITTILRNLLGNAFKFADPQRSNDVQLLMTREEDRLILSIRDSGIGIPRDQRDSIFEEFRQVADDARRHYEGSGLGLSMVRDLVRLMDGHIAVESEPGHGSTFIVSLPEQRDIHIQTQQPREANFLMPASRAEKVEPRALTIRGQRRVLVVDDNEINCEVIQHILENQGYEGIVAYGGREALVKMRTELPDLVLLDMMMPEISGEDVIQAMKADPLLQDIPVILITARASDDDRLFGLSLGADDYLAKPIHPDELVMRVRNLLHRLELNRRMLQLEERDRQAQLGELLGELSHELKNIFQFAEWSQTIDQRMLGRLIQRLPIRSTSWPRAADIIAGGDPGDSSEGGLEGLAFRSLKQSEDPILRSLRMRLAHLPLQQTDKLDIWQKIQELTDDDRAYCDHQLVLVRSFVLLRDQSRHARELIMDILEFNRAQDDQPGCDLVKTVEAVLKLCRPRLTRQRVRIELSLVPVPVRIASGAFMQILLNLLSNACDAMQELPAGERWIRVHAALREDQVVLRITNAGPMIPETIARSLFERGFTTKGSQGNGLGLSIVWRLLQKVQGSIALDAQASSPSFKITLKVWRTPGEAHAERT